MASKSDLVKRFNDFAGWDLRSGDLRREAEYSPLLYNVEIVKTVDRNLEKRLGGKIVGTSSSAPYLGIFNHQYVDFNGEVQEEIIGIDEQLRRRTTSTFTVDYAGAATSALISIYSDSDEIVCVIDLDQVETTISLGTGLEAVPVTMADLETAIEAIAGFTVTIVGTTTVPAAFLPLTLDQDVATAAYAMDYWEWEVINHTYGAIIKPFDTYESKKFESYFENADFENYEQCAWIATGYEYLHKYDGQTVYRVGLPEPSAIATIALVAAGAVTDTDVNYIYRYAQKDNRGITNYGTRSGFSANSSPAAENLDVTLQNVLAGTGFNTNCAQVNGAQVGVNTITVDAGHTLQVGDTAYFLDGATYVEREVTGIAATTFTVDGAAVTVADNAAISNNLRIQLWRNTAGGLEYYLVAELPNNSLTATTVYRDAVATATLLANEKYIAPRHNPDALDSKPKYLALHDSGSMCAAGDPEFHDLIFFNDPANPEGFPAATHQFLVKSRIAGPLSGIFRVKDGLAIFKERAVFVDSSDLPNLVMKRPSKEHEGQIGAVSNASIMEVGDDVWFLSYEGPRRLLGGMYLAKDDQGAVEVTAVDPLFRFHEMSANHMLSLKRAVGFADTRNDKLIWHIPAETLNVADRYPNNNSQVVIWDYSQKAWLSWRNRHFSCGMIDHGGAIWWAHKVYDSGAGTFESYLWRLHDGDSDYAYEDHHEAISWYFASQWESADVPDVDKLINYLTAYSQTSRPWSFLLDYQTERNYLADVSDSKGRFTFGADSSSGYGLGGWGIMTYGSPSVSKLVKKLNTDDKCESMRFVFSNNEHNQNVVLSGYSYPIAFPYGIRMKNG